MPIYSLLRNSAFDPDHVQLMSAAFEDLCLELGLAKREDPLRDMVAKAVIGCAQKGIRDPLLLRQCARDVL